MMNPSSRRSKWICGMHDLELGRGSYDIMKMLQTAKLEVPACENGGSGFHGSDPNLSRDFIIFDSDSPIHGNDYI
jgi:hypothetical protein